MRVRAPRHPALRPLVLRLWLNPGGGSREAREWVLPTGTAHVVVRLGEPLFVFPSEGMPGDRIGTAVVGGPRDAPYLRALGSGGPSVGAQLAPGALPLFLGRPAHELGGRHLSLTEFWGHEVELFRERLAEAPVERWLDRFEDFLLLRLHSHRTDPVIAFALGFFRESHDVGAAARATGYSHRTSSSASGAPSASSPRPTAASSARALEAGATLLRPVADHFYGERSGAIRDPFGHEWMIGHSIEELSPEEMQRRYEKL